MLNLFLSLSSGSQTLMIRGPLPNTLNTCGPLLFNKIPSFAFNRSPAVILLATFNNKKTKNESKKIKCIRVKESNKSLSLYFKLT